MKYLILLAALSLSTHAVEYEAGISYARVNQNLFGNIEFPMDAVVVTGTAWHDSGLGFRLALGRSTETANHLYVAGAHYTNKIYALYSGTIMYRFNIDKVTMAFGVGKTDYKSRWTVNGVEPSWSGDADSDWSYYGEASYPIEDNVSMTFGYTDLYRKDKVGYGRETTRAFTFGFIYKF